MTSDITDVDMAAVPPVFHPEIAAKQCVEIWTEKFNEGVLTHSVFKEHWRVWAPRIYSPSPNDSCLNWTFDEEEAKTVLFDTLERFICGGNPEQVLSSLSDLEKPPSVCGKAFKMCEPTYSCRECSLDMTCVLCVDCFKNSEHKNHKYKMGMSSGGGCCDCGDVEAWKKAPFCNIHIAGTQVQPHQKGLPEDIVERARIVFDSVLWYAYDILTLERTTCLSGDLRIRDTDTDSFLFDTETHCTLLYNDETHTFEQVINTLHRVLKCSKRNAVEFVTNIDREGRVIVECGSFVHCNEIMEQIEKSTAKHGNKPLKALVVSSYVVAHQLFALKLLAWLQGFFDIGEGFRKVFLEVVLKVNPSSDASDVNLAGISLLDGILLRDFRLWKSARTHWHRLLIAGMFKEYESKKALAIAFTKHYGYIMQDFIRDDQDHSFSVVSLSVQLFTVPTLVHYLIANQGVLFIVMNTFQSECSRKCKNNKLEFERNALNNNFKRAQYMLGDLKYLLGFVPEQWTNELKTGFLQGLSIILNILCMMQGMDSISRQVGLHMEYEPEWESAFNLHIKLSRCLSLAVEWCVSDRVVLAKAYRMTLKRLYDNLANDVGGTVEVRELADHSVPCRVYDVSSQPVSIHLPLTRFLAALHLHLQQHGLSFNGEDFSLSKPTPEEIIEPVLRTQVMIAQVHAGMWRRNGYALLNQLYFYHNVKCRAEMLDRDIVILQMGATLIESNEFLIHLLNKFNLLHWASPTYEEVNEKSSEEETTRQLINVVEEFLRLLIFIVSERHVPGVGQVTTRDRIKKEIIQQLCIKPMSHSELAKSIQEDSLSETLLDDIIEEIAVFKKPMNVSAKGVYELKSELYDQYDVFFYHYTREELSKSEEAQRKRHKQAGELECCPPPQLPLLTESFTMLANLLQCDVMLHIMQTVLERSANLKARCFSELQLHKVLHLIGYALQEEQSKNYPFLNFCERANRMKIQAYLEELSTSPRVEAHKDLIRWTLNKFRDVAAMNLSEPLKSSDQVSETPMQTSSDDKAWRAKRIAEQRAKILAQMKALQSSFMKENATLFVNTDVNRETSIHSGIHKQHDHKGSAMDLSESDKLVALGPNQSSKICIEKSYTCILCQEEQTVTADGAVLVLAGFVQSSTVLSFTRGDEDEHDHLFLTSNLGPAPHTSTCGHVMHSTCWQKYYDNVMLKELRRHHRVRHTSGYDTEKMEFLCPLCECLSNTVLPLLPSFDSLQKRPHKVDLKFEIWFKGLQILLENKIKVCHGVFKCNETCSDLHKKVCETETHKRDSQSPSECDSSCDMPIHQVFYPCELERVVDNLGEEGPVFAELFNSDLPELSKNIVDMIEIYIKTTCSKGRNPKTISRKKPLKVWKTCAYTIHAIETLLRDSEKSLLGDLSSRQRDCMESMVRVVAAMGSCATEVGIVNMHALKLISVMIENPTEGPSILDWDSLGMLVPLTFSVPNLFHADRLTPLPLGGTQDLHVFTLVLISHIVKVLLTADLNELVNSSMDYDEGDQTSSNSPACPISKIIDVVMKYRGSETSEGIIHDILWRHVQNSSLPFLRCCCLFYHYLTDVPAPPALCEPGGDTFSTILEYLGLPNNESLATIASVPAVLEMADRWCSHPEVTAWLANPQSRVLPREPPPINRLVELPIDYSELLNTVAVFTCPNSDKDESRYPAMCLVCGAVLCSQSYCCQTDLPGYGSVGACMYHAYSCGAGVGLFLRIRDCEIILLSSPTRGCQVVPPYLDEYGETDQGLRRGNPLHLCLENYKKLQTQWLSHGIQEEITRAIEGANSLMITPWHHM